MAATVATAGRAVFFSGVTVLVGLLGLVLFDFMVLRSVGVAGAIVVGLAVVAALTLLPAVLAILGPRLDAAPVRLPFSGLRARVLSGGARSAASACNGLGAPRLTTRHPRLAPHRWRRSPGGTHRGPARTATTNALGGKERATMARRRPRTLRRAEEDDGTTGEEGGMGLGGGWLGG